MIITADGMIIRLEVGKISQLGRATQGVRLINLRPGDRVTAIEVIPTDEGADDGENSEPLFSGGDDTVANPAGSGSE